MNDEQAPPPPPEAPPPSPPTPPPAPLPPTAPAGGSENRSAMLVLSYLWPFALIPYLMEKDDPEVQWHSKNGLVLLAAEIVINLVMGIIVGTGCLTCFLFWLPLAFWVADIGLHVYCIIKALDGKRVEIPYLSDLTRHIP